MSNRFEKAENRKKVAPGGEKKSEVEATIVPSPVVEPAKTENPFEVAIEQKPEGKTYGFYLSTEAAQKLENFAKTNGCSKSKALDAILKKLP